MEKTPFGYKKKEIIEIDWDSIPTGTKFTATILDKECSGLIYKEDEYIYLCQDTHEGERPDSGMTLGYKYSWMYSPHGSLENYHINDIKFTPNPSFKVPITFKLGSYAGIFNSKGFQVGCTLVDWKTLDLIFKEYQRSKPKTK